MRSEFPAVTSADLDQLRALWSGTATRASEARVAGADRVLLSAANVGTNAIMRETGKSKTCVWRWQGRFAVEGVDGLCATRHGPRASRSSITSVNERIVALTMGRRRTKRRIGPAGGDGRGGRHQREFGAAHLARSRAPAASCAAFKLSKDPAFVGKLRDIVGLYVDPPAPRSCSASTKRAKIQALDRTQPSLPLKKGRAGDHDPRLQAEWDDDPVRRDERARRNRHRTKTCNATGIRNLSASSTPSSGRFR